MTDQERWGLAMKLFTSLPVVTLVWKPLWEAFAGYLVHVHKKSGDVHLAASTVRNYLGAVLNAAQRIFQDKQRGLPQGVVNEAQTFFLCLVKLGGTPSWLWLSKLKRNVDRLCFIRCKKSGAKMDHSAKPLSLLALRKVIENYARCGNCAEAARRNLALLHAWLAVGRSAEVAWSSFDGRSFDACGLLTSEVFQSKTVKMKSVLLTPGADRFLCFYLALGDNLALSPAVLPDDNGTFWIHPKMNENSKPASVLGAFLKVQVPGRTHTTDYGTVNELPKGVTAASIRKGCVRELLRVMPPFFASMTSGHAFRSISAMFEYFDEDVVLKNIGAGVLAGWPAPHYGEYREEFVTPAQISVLNLDDEVVELLVDNVFRIHGESFPGLKRGGELRPLTHILLATQMQWYPERKEAGEMHDVVVRLRTSTMAVFNIGADEADLKLSHWSRVIKIECARENAAMFIERRVGNPDIDVLKRMMNAYQAAMESRIDMVRQESREHRDAATAEIRGLQASIKSLAANVSTMMTTLDALNANWKDISRESAREMHGLMSPSKPDGSGASERGPKRQRLFGSAAPSPSDEGASEGGAGSGGNFLVRTGHVPEKRQNAGLSAVDFLLKNWTSRGFVVPKMSSNEASKGQRIIDFFWSAATSQEQVKLREPSTPPADRRRILLRIEKGVVAYLVAKRKPLTKKMASTIKWSTIENCKRSFIDKSDYTNIKVKGNTVIRKFVAAQEELRRAAALQRSGAAAEGVI